MGYIVTSVSGTVIIAMIYPAEGGHWMLTGKAACLLTGLHGRY